MIKNPNATADELEAALKQVYEATKVQENNAESLVLKGDKTALEQALQDFDTDWLSQDTAGQTPQSIDAYIAAATAMDLAGQAAKDVLDDDNATQADVDQALAVFQEAEAALKLAIEGLTPIVSKDELKRIQDEIEEALVIDRDRYTPNSLAAYDDLLDQHQEEWEELQAQLDQLLADTDEAKNASAEEVAEVLAQLQDKLAVIQRCQTRLLERAVKDALEEELKQVVPTANTDGMTPLSVTAYENAKSLYDRRKRMAEDLLADPNALQADVDAAKDDLEAARQALEAAINGLTDKAETAELAKAVDAVEAHLAAIDGQSLALGDVTKASGKAYQAALAELQQTLAEAKALLADPDADQQKINQMVEQLDRQREQLMDAQASLVDLSELRQAEKAAQETLAEEVDTAGKTTASVEAYKKAKTVYEDKQKAAKVVLANDAATDDEVLAAKTDLDAAAAAYQAAVDGLVEVGDKSKLTEAVDEAKKDLEKAGDAGDVTKDSRDVFDQARKDLQTTIKEVEELLTHDEITVLEVKTAEDKLANQRMKLTEAVKNLVDLSALRQIESEAIKQLNQIVDTKQKTDESISRYKQALDSLKLANEVALATLIKENASKVEVAEVEMRLKQALANLQAAIDGLVDLQQPDKPSGKTPEEDSGESDHPASDDSVTVSKVDIAELPEAGESDANLHFFGAALSLLVGLGLVAKPRRREED